MLLAEIIAKNAKSIGIKKILIANRGEIAVRAITTCKRLGIKTVALYSEPDANFLPAVVADEAFLLKGSLSKDTYLDMHKILEIAKATGSEAVYPGYGFLSENTEFAALLEKNGIKFIGPNSKSIQAMGDKIESKKTAIEAGVSVVPGFNGVIKDGKHAFEVAKTIGYPVMLKASAGGGGKGIRISHSDSETEEMFVSVTNEATKSFGDGRIFIEKFVEQPRHIEIQVLADKHGNVVCMSERECSIQRNNQKVIEEAPSSFITPEVRAKMYAQSVMLAKKVGYDSAGTVEYIVDKDRNFYFLEMNTRLQVEHPVTEFITGVDMIEQMIRVADNQPLAFKQSDIVFNGWSFEARICSEDPSKNFIPSTGWIQTYQEPSGATHFDIASPVRVDSGVRQGCTITQFYDSMVAKLITHGKNRDEARKNLINALGNFAIEGIATNMQMVESILLDENFASGDFSTAFIKQKYPEGHNPKIIKEGYLSKFILGGFYLFFARSILHDRQVIMQNTIYTVLANGEMHSVLLKSFEGNSVFVSYNGVDFELKTELKNAHSFTLASKTLPLLINNETANFRISINGNNLTLSAYGSAAGVIVFNSKFAQFVKYFEHNAQQGGKVSEFEVPISGLVTAIYVKEGDVVNAGDKIITIEAMKMENILTAEFATKIKKIHTKVGEPVSVGDLLIAFDNS